MINNKKTIKTVILVAIAIAVAYTVRTFAYPAEKTLLCSCCMFLRYLIHVSLLIWWTVSLNQRMINVQVRRLLVTVGVLLSFWLTVRTVKYEFIVDPTNPILRYLWYAFYIPMILVPLFGIFVASFIGKPDDYKLPRKVYYSLIPSILLIVAVFTNDFHRLVFSFPAGIELFDSKYSYGVLYYVIMAWFILLGLYFVVTLVRKSRVPGSKKMQKLPIIIMICAVAFWITYSVFRIKVDLTAYDCLIIVSLLESAILSGMIPSNTGYTELFSSTTLPVLIIDRDYQPRYVSDGAMPVSLEDLRKSENGTVNLGDSILDSAKIKNGRVAWQSDVRKLNSLREHLDSICEQLSEENTLLQAEFELKERKVKTDEKNRLYDRIALEVSSQLDRIEELLKLAKAHPEKASIAMAKVNVIGSYIKRRGNLVLLCEDNKSISSQELELCLRESTDNLNLCGAYATVVCTNSREIPLETAISIYDFFEAVIERTLNELNAVMVHITFLEDSVNMRLQVGLTGDVDPAIIEKIPLSCGTYSCLLQEEDIIIDLIVCEGGAV